MHGRLASGLPNGGRLEVPAHYLRLAAAAAVKFAEGKEVETNSVINNGRIDVPSLLIEPVSVNKDNLYEIIVKSGFHKKEDVYKYVPRSEWPTD